MVTELQNLLISINNSIILPPILLYTITGVLFVMTLLSMKAISTFPIAKMSRLSVPLYKAACWTMLITVGVNRFLGYPPEYPLTSVGYIISYLLLVSYTVWGAYQYELKNKREEANGRQTISPA